MDPLLLAHHVALEPVHGQPRAATALRQRAVGGGEPDAALVAAGGAHPREHRQPVAADPAEQRVRQPLHVADGLLHVGARTAAVLRGRLRCGVVGEVGPDDAGRSAAVVHQDPGDRDPDREPLPVVDLHQRAQRPAVPLAEELLPLRRDRLQPRAVGLGVDGRDALHQHVLGPVAEAVLARVVRQRDVRVAAQPVELLRQAEGRVHGDRARLPVADPERRHRHRHDTPGGRDVGEPGRRVPADDLVHLVVPLDTHGRGA